MVVIPTGPTTTGMPCAVRVARARASAFCAGIRKLSLRACVRTSWARTMADPILPASSKTYWVTRPLHAAICAAPRSCLKTTDCSDKRASSPYGTASTTPSPRPSMPRLHAGAIIVATYTSGKRKVSYTPSTSTIWPNVTSCSMSTSPTVLPTCWTISAVS